jgi:hypothetical protein
MKARRIFISYAHQDYPLIQSISASVKDSNDLIWIDRNVIMPGDEWRGKIQKALKSSYCIIFFASTSSVKSKEVKLEIDYAIKLRKRVIPVLLEKCNLPYEVSNLQHINLTYRNQEEVEVFRQILSAISSKRTAKPATNKTAATIAEDIKTSNNFYNTVIVPNRFLWTSTVASIILFSFIAYFLPQANQSAPKIEHDDSGGHVLSKDTARIKNNIKIDLIELDKQIDSCNSHIKKAQRIMVLTCAENDSLNIRKCKKAFDDKEKYEHDKMELKSRKLELEKQLNDLR